MSAVRRAMRLFRTRPEAGISLVEMLVTMVLMGIVGTIVIGLFMSATKTVSAASSIHHDTGTASNIMNELSKVIRSASPNPVSGAPNAPALITATATKIAIYTYADSNAALPRPLKVEFSRDPTSKQLIEKRWEPTAAANGFWVFSSTPTLISTRTFPGIISNATVFTYDTAAGVSLTAPTAAQLATVASVSISLTVQAATGAKTTPVTLRNTVGMPNLGFSQTGTP